MVSNVVANPLLTMVVSRFMQDPSAFIGFRLFPLFFSAVQAANYYVFDAANMLNVPANLRRAPGAPYSRSMSRLSQDSFATEEFGHEEVADDRQRKKYANAVSLDTIAVRRGTAFLLTNHELRIRDLVYGANLTHSQPATQWDLAGSNPIVDVDRAKEAVRQQTGIRPNYLQMNVDVFNVLKEHPVLLDRIKYTERGVITEEIMASLFGVSQLVVAGALVGTSDENAALTAATIWGDTCILAVVNPSTDDDQMPNFGRTFAWTGETGPDGVLVESYRDDAVRGDVHRVRHDVSAKVVGPACAYRLDNCLSY